MAEDLEKLTDSELREKALGLLKSAGYPYGDFLSSMNTSREGLLDLIIGLSVTGFAVSDGMPDPAWDYIEHWSIANQLQVKHRELAEYLTDQEDATPEADAKLREYYREIQSLCIRGLGMLPEED